MTTPPRTLGSPSPRASARLARTLPGLARRNPAETALVTVALLSLVVILAQASAIVHQLYRDADTAVAFVLPQLAGHRPPGATIDLGNHNYYETWWFERATVGLPGHFAIWEAAPFIVDFIGILAVCWAVVIALGRRAALYTAAALLVIGDGMRQVVFEPSVRVGLLVHMGVLCVALLATWQRLVAGRATLRWLVACGVAVALVTAPGGTDQLLMIDGVVPFLVTAWLWWWSTRSRESAILAAFASIVAAASFVGEALLTTIMVHEGVSSSLNLDSFQFLQSTTWPTDVSNTVGAWVSLADGDFFGLPVNKADILTFVLGSVSLVALVAASRVTLRWARGVWDTAVHRQGPTNPETGVRHLFIGFWGSAIVMTFASFSLTSASTTADARYLLSAWIAVAALLGAVATTARGRSVLVVGLVTLSTLIVRDNIAFGIPAPGVAYPAGTVRLIERFVTAEHATTGFASYPYSHNFTWAVRFRVKVYPIWPCDAGRPRQLCQRELSSDSAWFVPRPGIRTFLITTPPPTAIAAAPASFGTPLATRSFGAFTVSVYPNDVAAHIAHY